MPGRRAFTSCLALVALAPSGCGSIDKEIKALADKHRAAIERNLGAWPAIVEQLRARPPLDKDGVEDDPVFVVDAFAGSSPSPSAALGYAEDLATPDELGYVWKRIENTGALNHCASFLHRGHSAFDPAQPNAKLRSLSLAETRERYPQCAGYRYLLVIRSLEFLEPSPGTHASKPFAPVKETLDPDQAPPPPPATAPPARPRHGRKGKTAKPRAEAPPAVEPAPEPELLEPIGESGHRQESRYVFEGGFLRGEVLVFELPAAKLLGGHRFTAQNQVEVKGEKDSTESDLAQQIHEAVRQALGKHPQAAAGGGGN